MGGRDLGADVALLVRAHHHRAQGRPVRADLEVLVLALAQTVIARKAS